MALRLENISKSFGDKKVLDGLSLAFPEKGISVIMAPSGTGKTTLLRIIAGLEKPDGGEVHFTENEKVSLMFQEDRLFPWLTALENVTVPTGVKASEARALLEAVELGAETDKFPDQLSGGMNRRVALARAMAGGGMLLLDEPFNGLDEELTERMLALLEKYAENAAVIIVTHDRRIADRTGGAVILP